MKMDLAIFLTEENEKFILASSAVTYMVEEMSISASKAEKELAPEKVTAKSAGIINNKYKDGSKIHHSTRYVPLSFLNLGEEDIDKEEVEEGIDESSTVIEETAGSTEVVDDLIVLEFDIKKEFKNCKTKRSVHLAYKRGLELQNRAKMIGVRAEKLDLEELEKAKNEAIAKIDDLIQQCHDMLDNVTTRSGLDEVRSKFDNDKKLKIGYLEDRDALDSRRRELGLKFQTEANGGVPVCFI